MYHTSDQNLNALNIFAKMRTAVTLGFLFQMCSGSLIPVLPSDNAEMCNKYVPLAGLGLVAQHELRRPSDLLWLGQHDL